MINSIINLAMKAQFGRGFEPPVEDHPFLEGSTDTDGVLSNLEQIISTIIAFITVLGGLFFLFNFLVAAFGMITTGGDKGKLENARDRMIYSVLGLIIVVATYAIVGLLSSVIGLDILNPAEQIRNLAPI